MPFKFHLILAFILNIEIIIIIIIIIKPEVFMLKLDVI